MLTLANLLYFLSAALLLALSLSRRRSNPEGPVGAHMVTAPLAVAQATATALGLAAGAAPALGALRGAVWLIPPGQLVGWTVLPIIALEPRAGWAARAAIVASLVGGALLLDAATIAPDAAHWQWIGLGLTAIVATFGYGVLIGLVVESARNQRAVARSRAERISDFERNQAEWQRNEWSSVPKDAPLWRLVQFTHAFDEGVAQAARARIAELPDLDALMAHTLLETGWWDEGLRCMRDCYPRSRAALAPALSTLLARERGSWQSQLAGPSPPGSWEGNLTIFVDVARVVQEDGGDVRDELGRWAEMLSKFKGLERLANLARRLAN